MIANGHDRNFADFTSSINEEYAETSGWRLSRADVKRVPRRSDLRPSASFRLIDPRAEHFSRAR